MLARAERRFRGEVAAGRLRLVEGSLTDLPFGDDALDGAITTNTVYFVPDLGGAFAELARVLRPTGRVVVGIGDPEAMAKLPMTPYGFTLRPVDDVIATLEQAGLKLAEHRKLGAHPGQFHLLVASPQS